MRLKSKTLLVWFGCIHEVDESEIEEKIKRGEVIPTIDLSTYGNQELDDLIDDLEQIITNNPSAEKFLMDISVKGIQSKKEVDKILKLASSNTTVLLQLEGKLDELESLHISHLKNIEYLMLANVGLSPAQIRELELPQNNVDIDFYNVEVDDFRELNSDIKKVYYVSNVSELTEEDLENANPDYIAVIEQNESNPIKNFPYIEYTTLADEMDRKRICVYNFDNYKKILAALRTYASGINDRWSQKRKFNTIYNRICAKIEYDENIENPSTEDERNYAEREKFNSRDLLNALLIGKCVCGGYADTLKNECSLIGIDSNIVYGKLNGGNHVWVRAKIDGYWYNFDPTNDHEFISRGLHSVYSWARDEDLKNLGYEFETDANEPCNHINFDRVKIILRRYLTDIYRTKNHEPIFLPALPEGTDEHTKRNEESNPFAVKNYTMNHNEHNMEPSRIKRSGIDREREREL